MRSLLKLVGVCAGALAAANPLGCGSSTNSGFPEGDGGGAATGGNSGSSGGSSGGFSSSGGSSGGFSSGGSSGDGAAPSNDCPPGASKYIYVADDQNELYTFDPTVAPAATAFTKLGTVNCPGEMTPPDPNTDQGGVNSMAVDRQATAWINFNDGKIFKVDTTQASLPCTATTFTEGSSGFTPQLGMGFATVSATDDTETLYVSDNGGPGGACTSMTPGAGCMGLGLGSVTSTLTLMPIGPYTNAAGYNAELSGTGDGTLYGFFTTSPSELGTIDKASGTVTSIIPLPTVNNSVGGYAFSFWGGDFWIYTAFPTDADPNATTSVTHFVSSTKTASVVMADIGFTIVGAGSSTCVPTVPVQ
jgi:hypothetical protein